MRTKILLGGLEVEGHVRTNVDVELLVVGECRGSPADGEFAVEVAPELGAGGAA